MTGEVTALGHLGGGLSVSQGICERISLTRGDSDLEGG